MSDIETLQTELRIQSVDHSNKIAKAKKAIDALLRYELDMAIALLEDGQPSERVLPLAKDIARKLSAIRNF